MSGRQGLANAIISLRWLALAALIALQALLPTPASRGALLGLYAGILAYTLGLTLYVWRYPQHAGRTAQWGIPLDTLAVAAGMFVTGHSREFLLLAFPVAAVGGLILGYGAAALVAAAAAAAQFPGLGTSLFAPGGYVSWAFTNLAVLAAGTAAAAGAEMLRSREDATRTLVDLQRVMSSSGSAPAAAKAALAILVARFRADSGSLMLFDPHAGQLEILAAHHLGEAYRDVHPRVGEGIAGWVVQEGRPVLLTPDAAVPFRLSRREIGSSMCIPVGGPRGPLGVLNLNRSTSSSWFTQDDLDTADLAAQQVGGLLLHAQSDLTFAAALTEMAEGFGHVSRAMARDPVVLWPALLDIARSLTSAHFAVLALEREDTGNVDIVATRGIDGRTAREFLPALLAASTQEEIRVAEGGPMRNGVPTSVACVPLRADSRILGAVGLGLSDAHTTPRLLQAVAAHVAAAVLTTRSAQRIADIGVSEERRRIAREMHDGLAQTLAEAMLQTDLSGMTIRTNPDELAADLKELRGLLERAMRELREFMSELRRQDQQEATLLAALEGMGRDFGRRYEIPTTVSASGSDARLPSAVRHAVLAIVRQALTNIRAHAQATQVRIAAEVTDEACTVTVADNGVGFDLAATRARTAATHHLGITSMEERASLVGGTLRIESAPGRGTTVTVRVPFGSDA